MEESREPVATAWRIFCPSDNSESLSGRAVPPSSLSVRTSVPSAVKQLAANPQEVQSASDVLVFLHILHFYRARGVSSSGILYTTWKHADKSDSKGLGHQRGTGEPVVTAPLFHPLPFGPLSCQVPPPSGRGCPAPGLPGAGPGRVCSGGGWPEQPGWGGPRGGVSSGGCPAPHKAADAQCAPAAAPAGRRGGEAAPMLQSGHGRPALVGPPAGWQLGGGLVRGQLHHRACHRRVLQHGAGRGSGRRAGGRREGASLRGCGASGCPRQESLHAPFSRHCSRLFLHASPVPFQGIWAPPALPVIFF